MTSRKLDVNAQIYVAERSYAQEITFSNFKQCFYLDEEIPEELTAAPQLFSQELDLFGGRRWRARIVLKIVKGRSGINDIGVGIFLLPISSSKTRPRVSAQIEVSTPISLTPICRNDFTCSFQSSGYGYPEFIRLSRLRTYPEIINQNAFTVRFQVYEPQTTSTLAVPPVMDLNNAFFNSPPDVVFFFKNKKKLYAHQDLLKKRSSYFTALFSENFAEGSKRARINDKEINFEVLADDSDVEESDEDDESEEDSPSNTENDVPEGESEQPLKKRKISHNDDQLLQIPVTNISINTYRGMLSWLYFKSVNFKVYDNKVAHLNRYEQLYNAVSPKSLFKISDMYNIEDLKALSLQRFADTLTPQQAVRNLGSSIVHTLPALKEALELYLSKHAREIMSLGSDKLQGLLTPQVGAEGTGGLLATLLTAAATAPAPAPAVTTE